MFTTLGISRAYFRLMWCAVYYADLASNCAVYHDVGLAPWIERGSAN